MKVTGWKRLDVIAERGVDEDLMCRGETRPGVGVHGLRSAGCTIYGGARIRERTAMCDASRERSGARWGRFEIKVGSGGRWRTIGIVHRPALINRCGRTIMMMMLSTPSTSFQPHNFSPHRPTHLAASRKRSARRLRSALCWPTRLGVRCEPLEARKCSAFSATR